MCSPTAGGGEACVARSRSNESGSAGSAELGDRRRARAAGACRARSSAPPRRRRRRRRPARPERRRAVSRACQSAVSRSREPRRRRWPTSSSRLRTRSGFVRKRSSRDELGSAEHVAEEREEAVVAAGDHELAVARREAPGTARPSGTPFPARRHRAVREVADEVVADVAERGLVERGVDDRALARSARARAARRRSRAPTTSRCPCR